MTTTLVIPELITNQLIDKANLSVESAGVLLARFNQLSNGDIRLLAREMHWVQAEAYKQRTENRMSITPEGYINALAYAESQNAIPIWFHTHPGKISNPLPSIWDKIVDEEISDLFQLRSGSDHYGTLIASPAGEHLAFSGTLQYGKNQPIPINKFWSVGNRWRMNQAFDADSESVKPMFDRNVRAFGPAIQQSIGMLRIAIVGAGGTGSAVAEQLVRLGASNLMLVDADRLSHSNVTRVYGSTPADVGKLKVDILRNHLCRIAPDLCCETICSMANLEPIARELSGVDLIFGCTDDNAGRLVLSRLSTYFLIPVIDLGALISSTKDGKIDGIHGRVTILTPGAACLVCRNRIDMARASAEMKTPEERNRLADEGYAPALGQVEPAVVAYTTAVAATAISELLERLIGYGPNKRPNEILLRLHEREISTNHACPRPGHYCHKDEGKWGAGPEDPFLGQLWPE